MKIDRERSNNSSFNKIEGCFSLTEQKSNGRQSTFCMEIFPHGPIWLLEHQPSCSSISQQGDSKEEEEAKSCRPTVF